MHVAMIGSGYVGLVTGACLADFGHVVHCVDKDPAKVALLRDGGLPIFEPGLAELVARNVEAGRLSFSDDLARAVAASDVVFIAVGTPPRAGDGQADLSAVHQVAREIGPALEGFTVVVTKSTVPVGTGDEVERLIRKANPKAAVAVASNPEFLREGDAIADFKEPDRVVVGTEDARAGEVMRELYRPVAGKAPILVTSRRTAELTKYAANAFLATKIAFINEIADLCEEVGANVLEVSRGIGLDHRIGAKFLAAGPGYGGSCFPKDTMALIRTARDYGAPVRITETVMEVNQERKRAMGRKVIQACGGSVRGRTIAVLGLTFKPNTDDMRESPAIPVIQTLQEAGARIRAYDPEGIQNARALLREVAFCDEPYSCAEGADALVVVTEWDAFRGLDLERLKQALRRPLVIDLRNIYDPAEMRARGFTYHGTGIPNEAEPDAAPHIRPVLKAI